MARDLAAFTKEIFPTIPDRLPLFPADAQQRALTGLRQDIADGLHLLCLTGPAGSGKTALLQTLRQTASAAVVALIPEPTPGRLLFDTAKALHVGVPDDNESMLRRRLGMRLVSSEQRRHRPLLLIDSAQRLLPEDLDLLFHFFPRRHASVVLASTDDPAEWPDSAAVAALPEIDRTYRLGPLSAAETEGYIRHRLRESSLPDDLFQPDAIATIHAQSGGLPRRINQLCAETLARAGERGDDSVAARPPTDQDASSVETPAGSPPAPLVARRRRTARTSQHMEEPALPPPAADVRPLYAQGPAARVPHRMQRRRRLWRNLAIVASLILIAVLTLTLAGARNGPPGLLGDAMLQNALAQLSASLRPTDDMARTAPGDAAAEAAPTVDSMSAAPADQASATRAAPPDTAASRPPVAGAEPIEAAATASAASSADTTGAKAAPPDTARQAAVQTEPTPQEPVSAPETPMRSSTARVPESTVAEARGRVPARLPAAERARLGRLYAERASYEWRNGDLRAADRSIRLGLASDPGNPVLLSMRADLRSVLRGE